MTAYQMRISDWSSDVCSSVLLMAHLSPLLFACALVLATGLAWSQQIRQPEPWGVQPAPRPVQPQVIPANPGQRPRSTSPVPGEGPAKLLPVQPPQVRTRSEEHTSELQSLMRISYAVFCLKKKK